MDKEIIQWAEIHLKNNGYSIKAPIEPVRLMPWSNVFKYQTSKGDLFLKTMRAPFTIESTLLPYLTQHYQERLPSLTASNTELHCLLMEDAGTPLRDRLKENYQVDLVTKTITDYASIQQKSVSQLNELIQLGLNDWRLEHLPSLYAELLEKETFLLNDGLRVKEVEQLKKQQNNFAQLCERLAQYNIPETIEHGDFHDNNILIKNGHLTICDWGDAIIAHPFFSIITFLFSAEKQHSIKARPKTYQTLKNIYLNAWKTFETQENLETAFKLAEKINLIKFSLGFYRIWQCADVSDLKAYQGFIAEALRLQT